MPHLRAVFGLAVLLGLALLLSSNRRGFPAKAVLGGLALQFALAVFVLQTAAGEAVFTWLGNLVAAVINASNEGARFVFGSLVDERGSWGFVFAVRALPNIVVFSSLSAIGYHFGVLQRVVGAMAWVMARLMGTSGAESLSAAANVFLGQTEAPLLVRPYIPRMTISELNAVMIGGFATIAGSLMAAYAQILGHDEKVRMAEMARHLLAASLISAPAALVVAKIMIPERDTPDTAGRVRIQLERTTRNVIDAAATGAAEGLKLALNVAAMLIAFIAIIALLDRVLIWFGDLRYVAPLLSSVHVQRLDLDTILGVLFSPVAWLIGLRGDELQPFASLLGKAMAANEFIAYQSLEKMARTRVLSDRSVTLAIYSLCGFANFSSIAIQIAGIGGMAPNRYPDLVRLGLRAMIGGAIACWMTACIAGTMISDP